MIFYGYFCPEATFISDPAAVVLAQRTDRRGRSVPDELKYWTTESGNSPWWSHWRARWWIPCVKPTWWDLWVSTLYKDVKKWEFSSPHTLPTCWCVFYISCINNFPVLRTNPTNLNQTLSFSSTRSLQIAFQMWSSWVEKWKKFIQES